MTNRAKTFGKKPAANYVRRAFTALLAICILAAGLLVRIDTEASSDLRLPKGVVDLQPIKPVPSPTPEVIPLPSIPSQTPAIRVQIIFGEKSDLRVATEIDSFLFVSPEIASAEITNRFMLSISALKIGETMLLVTSGKRLQTYVVAVGARPAGFSRHKDLNDPNGIPRAVSMSGAFTTLFTRQLSGGPSVLRQNVDLRQKLSAGRTLRVSGEMFKLFGNGGSNAAITAAQGLAFNRMSIGIDTAKQRVDIVDSQVDISPMSLNSYTLRGPHLTKTPKSDPKANLQQKGIEVFAGLARPSLAFFDATGGKVAGAMIPVLTRSDFQARAGFMAISADRNYRQASGGVIVQADATYAPSKEIFADAEVSYARGDLSWRGRLDLRYSKYGASTEITRFARSSPLNSIGAQPGGRKSENLSLYWRPASRLSASVGYNHTQISRLANSQLADFDRSLLFVNANYTVAKGSRVNFRYTDQKVETAFPWSLSKFEIQTRTISVGNTHRFGRNWSNNFEVRLNFSREAEAGEGLEKGFSVKEQLRVAWRGSSFTAFSNYTNKTPSLTSLIVRNPQLLPPVLQTAFALDPAGFLHTYRDRLRYLLGGIELPQTRSFDAGLRFQKTLSRFTAMGEVEYNAGEVFAAKQKYLYMSASVLARLDRANSIQVNGWKTFGGQSRSGVTISYTHQFGMPGAGYQLSRLFNFGGGKIQGRVFYDLNGNGLADPVEPGVAGMKIQIDDKRSVTTDKNGRYELAANEGRHSVMLVSSDLGVRLLASTSTEQKIEMFGGQKLDLNFGVRDSGSISGRIFNDSELTSQDPSGIAGVRVILRSADSGFGSFVLERISGADGNYEFSNLRPGKYTVEIDPGSLPANYLIPGVIVASITVEPIHSSYHDISVRAQRAVTGTVFLDKDGDGRYTVGLDEPIRGASVTVDNKVSISGVDGRYIIRDLPAGKTILIVNSPGYVENRSTVVELGAEPTTLRAVDTPLEPR